MLDVEEIDEETRQKYLEILNLCKNPENGKYPINPIHLKNSVPKGHSSFEKSQKHLLERKKLIQDSLNFFLGGCEIERVSEVEYKISSKGYYYYIGA